MPLNFFKAVHSCPTDDKIYEMKLFGRRQLDCSHFARLENEYNP